MSGKADGTIYIDTAIEKDGFTAGGNEVVAACRRIAEKVKMIGRTASASFQKQINSFEKQNLAYAQQEKKVEALRKKLEELNNTRVETPEFAEVSKQIEQARAKLARLEKAQEDFLEVGGKTNSKAYKRRQLQIEELRNEIRYAKGEQEDLLNSGKAYTTPDTSTAEEQLRQEEEKLYSMHQRLGTSYESLKAKAAAYEQKVNALARTLRLFNAGANLAVKGIKKMGSVLKNWIKKIKSANKETKRYRMSMGKMLASSILLSTVFHGISNVTEGIKSGFENLAQYSDSTNRSISSMMSALTRLKNSFATAFEPIFTVVAPIITSFINMLSKAITYIGMFFAALTGQKTFKQAKAVQEDYAAGLNDTTSATNDAADAQKDLNEANNDYLSGLDEIHKFETDSSSSGSSGGGSTGGSDAGGVSIGDMFEEVPIDSTVSGIVDKIKEAFAKEDWQGLGKWMADGINKGLDALYDAINWNKLGKKITKVVDAFTETFNSLVDNINWKKLGKTIGAGINTLVKTLNRLIEKIKWKKLGKQFAKGVNGLLDEVDWKGLGNLFGNKFMIAWNIINGFFHELNWGELGKSIAEALNGVFEKIDFKTIADTLVTGINGVFKTLANFTETFDWTEFASNIGNGISHFLQNMNWTENGKALANFIHNLCTTLVSVMTYDNFYQLGKGIAEFMQQIDWGELLLTAAKLFINAFFGLISGLVETPAGKVVAAIVVFFESAKIISKVSGAFKTLFGSAISDGAAEAAGSLGGLSGIKLLLSAIGGSLGGALTGLILGLKLGEKTTSTSADLSPVSDSIDTVTSALERLNEKSLITNEQLDALNAELQESVDSGLDSGNTYAGIGQSLYDMGVDASDVKEILDQLGVSAGDDAMIVYSWIKSLSDGTIKTAEATKTSVDSIAESAGHSAAARTSSGFSKAMMENKRETSQITKQYVKESVKDAASEELGNSFETYGANTAQGLSNGILSGAGSATTQTRVMFNQMKSTFANAYATFKGYGEDITKGLTNGINESAGTIKTALLGINTMMFGMGATIAQSIANGIQSIHIPTPTLALAGYSNYGVGTSKISMPQFKLSYLASGAVIPPNKEFMAVLGDQKHGTNIETPENLLRKIIREEIGNKQSGNGGNYTFVGQINRRTLFEEVISEAKLKQSISGRNPFDLG